MTKRDTDPGYKFPTPFDPGEYSCIVVYVPKHTLYYAAFWRAYEYFTTWYAWARDPLHTGKKVGELWLRGFERARKQFDNTKGECIMAITDIRIDPLDACNIQIQIDGGAEWIDKISVGNCGGGGGGSPCPVLRYNGAQLECYDTCTKTWSPIGEATDQTVNMPLPPIAILPNGSNCDATANMADYVYQCCKKIEGGLANLEGVLTSILEAYIIITAAFPITEWLAALATGFFNADSEVGKNWEQTRDFDTRPSLRAALFPYVKTDGTIDQQGFDSAIHAVEQLQHDAITTPIVLAWGDVLNIMHVIGPNGLSRMNSSAGIVGADCTTYEYNVVYDLTKTPGPFAPTFYFDGYNAQWVNGIGWKTVLRHIDGVRDVRICSIQAAFQPASLTNIDFAFHATNGINDGSIDELKAEIELTPSGTVYVTNDDEGAQHINWLGSEDGVTGLGFSRRSGVNLPEDGVTDPGGEVFVTQCSIRGRGLNPFPAP